MHTEDGEKTVGETIRLKKSSLKKGLILKQNPVKICQVTECFKATCSVSEWNLHWGISAIEAQDEDNRWKCDNTVTDDRKIKWKMTCGGALKTV